MCLAFADKSAITFTETAMISQTIKMEARYCHKATQFHYRACCADYSVEGKQDQGNLEGLLVLKHCTDLFIFFLGKDQPRGWFNNQRVKLQSVNIPSGLHHRIFGSSLPGLEPEKLLHLLVEPSYTGGQASKTYTTHWLTIFPKYPMRKP